jgi:hypothetical protein
MAALKATLFLQLEYTHAIWASWLCVNLRSRSSHSYESLIGFHPLNYKGLILVRVEWEINYGQFAVADEIVMNLEKNKPMEYLSFSSAIIFQMKI